MGNVLEFLVDGTSGLAPGGVDGSGMVAGVCSKGEVGKAYLIGKRSNLSALLGSGPLVERARDILATGGQEPVLIAVPVRGQSGGYISKAHVTDSRLEVQIIGVPQTNADVVITVTTPGAPGTAVLSLSLDKGTTKTPLPSAASMSLGSTGVTLVVPESTVFMQDTVIRLTVRTDVGTVTRHGPDSSPMLTVEALSGGVLAGADLLIRIVRTGGCNEGTYQLSIDGGDTFQKTRTIPIEGSVVLDDYGVAITFPQGTYEGGTSYACALLAPAPGIADVMEALEKPLANYDVEFVHIAGPSDSVDWAAVAALADELWNRHQPTYFKMEARLSHDGEDVSDYAAALLEERSNFAGRFVQVCAQFGEVSDASGIRKTRNWCGLQAGRTMSVPVQRATGRVKDGPISQGTLPDGWEAVQPVLEDAGYLTAKKYAGLQGVYWGDSRTMAEDTSDYRYEEVLRVAFKAVRKLRIAALKSLYDEAGDPYTAKTSGGLAYLKAQLANALDTMTKASPQELAAYVIDIPPGQDIINNGVSVETTLIGIGIMREIRLYASYVYAGGRFDPRMNE